MAMQRDPYLADSSIVTAGHCTRSGLSVEIWFDA